nr:hypothetical protein L203_00138 [Cryptococcus depauperatus CBS 7841]
MPAFGSPNNKSNEDVRVLVAKKPKRKRVNQTTYHKWVVDLLLKCLGGNPHSKECGDCHKYRTTKNYKHKCTWSLPPKAAEAAAASGNQATSNDIVLEPVSSQPLTTFIPLNGGFNIPYGTTFNESVTVLERQSSQNCSLFDDYISKQTYAKTSDDKTKGFTLDGGSCISEGFTPDPACLTAESAFPLLPYNIPTTVRSTVSPLLASDGSCTSASCQPRLVPIENPLPQSFKISNPVNNVSSSRNTASFLSSDLDSPTLYAPESTPMFPLDSPFALIGSPHDRLPSLFKPELPQSPCYIGTNNQPEINPWIYNSDMSVSTSADSLYLDPFLYSPALHQPNSHQFSVTGNEINDGTPRFKKDNEMIMFLDHQEKDMFGETLNFKAIVNNEAIFDSAVEPTSYKHRLRTENELNGAYL